MIKKSKPLNIILLIVVVGIYGIIAFRSFNNAEINNQSFKEVSNFKMAHGVLNYKKESYDLPLYINDPFKINFEGTNLTNSGIMHHLNFEQNSNGEIVKWPTIKYFGFIKNSKKGRKLVLLKINKKTVKLTINESYKSLQVLSIYQDSVKVKYKDEIKFIKKY